MSSVPSAPFRMEMGYVAAIVLVAAMALLRLVLWPVFGDSLPYITFHLAVVAAALWYGFGPGLFATLLSLVVGNLAYVPPFGHLVYDHVALTDMALTFLVNLVVTFIGGIAHVNHVKAEQAAEVARRARRALQDSEQRFRAVVEQSHDGIIIINCEGRILEWNAGEEAITGIPAAETLGRPLWEVQDRLLPSELKSPDFADAAREKILRGFREGMHLARDIEDEIQRPDGTRRTVQSSIFAIRSGDDTLACGICRDITAQRKSRGDLEAAQRAAVDANKSKDEFIAVLSHELRNPLNAVLAAADVLHRGSQGNAEMQETVDMVRRNAELEARLIDDLLDLSRIEHGKIELIRRPVELIRILDQAIEVCRPDLDARLLRLERDEKCDYWLNADAARLQQVIWNLLRNAIKFTHEGGEIRIECRSADDSSINISVIDTGEGIAPAALGRIFNAFEQAEHSMRRRFGGLGLGLSICKTLVELHGGTITAHSDGKGKGSSFTVCLPLIPPSEIVPVAARSPEDLSYIAPQRGLRILLVEDHGDTARIMRQILTSDGHQVFVAPDVSSAMALAQAHVLDVLLSDLGLPDGSGIDLLHKLRAAGLHFPAIALSGFGQDQDFRETREAGFAAHLTKPIRLQALRSTIQLAVRTAVA